MDLTHLPPGARWFATGFFTPEYRPKAEALAASLRRYEAPFWFTAVERTGDWNSQTKRKPSVALQAMDAHPHATILLMDVDCELQGSLDPLMDGFCPAADVACYASTRYKNPGRRQRFAMSSRVMLLRPNPRTSTFLKVWDTACRSRPWVHGDEPNIIYALAHTNGITFANLPLEYAARDGDNPSAVIIHRSAAKEFGYSYRRSWKTWLPAVSFARKA